MGGYFSAAPKACLRKRIVLSTPSLMRYGVTFRYPSGILLTMVVPPSLRPERSRFEEEVRTIYRGRTPRVYSGAGSRREAKTLYACRGMPLRGNFQTVRRGPHRRSCTPRATNLSRAEIIRFEIEAKLGHDCVLGSGTDGTRAGAWQRNRRGVDRRGCGRCSRQDHRQPSPQQESERN